jgi:hypothetical protein
VRESERADIHFARRIDQHDSARPRKNSLSDGRDPVRGKKEGRRSQNVASGSLVDYVHVVSKGEIGLFGQAARAVGQR